MITVSAEIKPNPGTAYAALMVNPHIAASPPYYARICLARARALTGHDDLARLASNENPDGFYPAVLASFAMALLHLPAILTGACLPKCKQ